MLTSVCWQFVERGLVLLNSDEAPEAEGLEVCFSIRIFWIWLVC